MTKLGLISGGGFFPLWVAQEAKQAGRTVYTAALHNQTSKEIEKFSEEVLWIRLGELGKMTKFFQRKGVAEAIMAGHVRKPQLFSGKVWPDLAMVKLLASVRNWKDETLLGAVAEYLSEQGIRLIDSTTYLRDALPAPGVLTRRRPTKKELEDISFGFGIAKRLAEMDVGQAVVVKDRCVVAVESMEGTDETLWRGGRLANQGATAVKVARPRQDMRFDVPAIGLDTVRTVVGARISVIAIEAGKTILFQRREALQLADQEKISVVAVTESEMLGFKSPAN